MSNIKVNVTDYKGEFIAALNEFAAADKDCGRVVFTENDKRISDREVDKYWALKRSVDALLLRSGGNRDGVFYKRAMLEQRALNCFLLEIVLQEEIRSLGSS